MLQCIVGCYFNWSYVLMKIAPAKEKMFGGGGVGWEEFGGPPLTNFAVYIYKAVS